MILDNQAQLNMFYDEPVSFKGLKLYPVKMRKYFQFFTVADILVIDKNSIPDINIISKTYLAYLIEESNSDNLHIDKLDVVLRLALKDYESERKIRFLTDNNGGCFIEIDDNIVLDSKDFEYIRTVIANQNVLSIPNEKIEKSLRDAMEESNRVRQKIQGNKTASLEDQMIAVMISTGIAMEDIYGMTIRKFTKAIERIDHKLHYELYLAATLNGTTFKGKSPVKHWLSDLERDKFEGLVKYEEIESKIAGAKV